MPNITAMPDEYLYILMNKLGLDVGLDPAIKEKYSNMDEKVLQQKSAEMMSPDFWKSYDMEATGNYYINQVGTSTNNTLSSDKLNELYGAYQTAGGKGQLWGKSGYNADGEFVGQNADYNRRSNELSAQFGVSGGNNVNSANPYEREMAQLQSSMDWAKQSLDLHEAYKKDNKLSGYKLNDDGVGMKKSLEEYAQKFKDLQAKSKEWESTATDGMRDAPFKDQYGLMRTKDGYLPGQDVSDPNNAYTLRNIFGWGEGGMSSDKMPTPEDMAYFKQTGQNPFQRPDDAQIDTANFRTYADDQRKYQETLTQAQKAYEDWLNLDATAKDPWVNSQEEIADNPWAQFGIKKYKTVDRYTENLNRLKTDVEARQNDYSNFMSQYGSKLNDPIMSAPGTIKPRDPMADMSFESWLNSDTGGKKYGYTGGYTSDNYLWMQQNPKDPSVVASNQRAADLRGPASPTNIMPGTIGNVYTKPGWYNDGSNNIFYGAKGPPKNPTSNSGMGGLFT